MDEQKLKKLARDTYWPKIESNAPKAHLEWYIDELLPAEIEWAEQHPLDDGRKRFHYLDKDNKCDLLVSFVGFSIEPLLQTVYVYEPDKVLLLHSENYGDPDEEGYITGKRFTRIIRDCISKVVSNLTKDNVRCELLEHNDVLSIFRTLREAIDENANNVIIDITGGKKVMVASAFLYAAYANIGVSYVDFDDEAYHPIWGRPYGHRCRIGILENPYQKFALRDWEQARTLYKGYDFRAAKKLLKYTIRPAATAYLPEQINGIDKLISVLECYEAWDNIDFQTAKNKADKITYIDENKFPIAIKQLGGAWTRRYKDIPKFRIYVYGEIKRIERLCTNAQYRETFLRAANLNEIIMTARLVKEFNEEKQKDLLDFLDNPENKTPNVRDIFKALYKVYPNRVKIVITGRKPAQMRPDSYYLALSDGSPELETSLSPKGTDWWNQTTEFQDDSNNNKRGWENFLDKRNSLAHSYETITCNEAKDAIRFVQANFEDFLGSTLMEKYGPAKILPWSELCTLCGLAQYLPLNLRKDK